MVLSPWIIFTEAIPHGLQGNVLELLCQAGIAAQTPGDGVPELGIVVFDAVQPEVLEQVRGLSRTASILGISLADPPLGNRQAWSVVEAGASDVLRWPALPPRADDVACRLQRWRAVQQSLDSPVVRASLVGASLPWRRLVREIVEVAMFTEAPVLVTGESGTGKELIARLIHDLDPRPDKGEFVVVDCTTISPELSGSEFFGHERGAFTGALAAREGAFALANSGTLFLDEVGELAPPLQAQLLRVVQEHQFKRVGSNLWQATEFRLVCATNRDLAKGMADGGFRADLFYRIAGWQCRTVPLRERKDDILPLARFFFGQIRPDLGEVEFDDAVSEFFLTRDYPGNVRELRQLVARVAHRHAGANPITIGDIPPGDRAPDTGRREWPEDSFWTAVRLAVELGIGMKEISQAAADLAVTMAIEREGGNLQRAAARLGVTDRALQLRRAQQRTPL
jgi:transcriptional regulator with GAF, ATPase, and Fis domain